MSPLPPSTSTSVEQLELSLSNDRKLQVKEIQPCGKPMPPFAGLETTLSVKDRALAWEAHKHVSIAGSRGAMPTPAKLHDRTEHSKKASHHDRTEHSKKWRVKEVQSHGEDAQSVKDIQPQSKDIQPQVKDIQPQSKDIQPQVKEIQPQVIEIQPQIEEVLPHGKDAEPVKDTQPQVKETLNKFRFVQPQSKDIRPQVKEIQPQVKEIQPQVKEVSNFQQKRQAELDEWMKFRKAHSADPILQLGKRDAESVTEAKEASKCMGGFSEEKQADLDEWREFRKAHDQLPENPLKTLTDLFDIDGSSYRTPANSATSAPILVPGLSSSKRKSKRRSGGARLSAIYCK